MGCREGGGLSDPPRRIGVVVAGPDPRPDGLAEFAEREEPPVAQRRHEPLRPEAAAVASPRAGLRTSRQKGWPTGLDTALGSSLTRRLLTDYNAIRHFERTIPHPMRNKPWRKVVEMSERSLVPSVCMLLVGVALAFSLLFPTVGVAQEESSCGWCSHHSPDGTVWHGFPFGGDSCGGWPPDCGSTCATCGGDKSACHVVFMPGSCHAACGASGDQLAEAFEAIQHGLKEEGIVAVAVAVVAASGADVTVEYRPAGGRIDFFLASDPSVVAKFLPVPPGDIRNSLSAELASLMDLEPMAAVLSP